MPSFGFTGGEVIQLHTKTLKVMPAICSTKLMHHLKAGIIVYSIIVYVSDLKNKHTTVHLLGTHTCLHTRVISVINGRQSLYSAINA